MKKIILTGSSGFVGSNIHNYFKDKCDKILCLNRAELTRINSVVINENTSAQYKHFYNTDSIIHCAGLAHKPHGKYKYKDIEETNVKLSINLLKLAGIYKVKKFIYISSAKVVGDSSETLIPFNEKFLCNPNDDYSKSKYESEKKLIEISGNYEIQLIILRPPLIYGPGVKGNFLKLIKHIDKFSIIPHSNDFNQRSYISTLNLSNIIETIINKNFKGITIYFISDDNDLSLVDISKKISILLKRKIFIIKIPNIFVKFFIKRFTRNIYNKLFSSFILDINKFKKDTGWEALKNDSSLEQAIEYYKKHVS